MVDANGGADFTVDDLIEMREAHEKQAKRRETIDKTIQKVRGGRKQAEARLPVIPSPRVCRWHGALRPRSDGTDQKGDLVVGQTYAWSCTRKPATSWSG
jgi:hypothetical protein